MPDLKYLCSICGRMYDTYEEAIDCESVPVQEARLTIGQEIRRGKCKLVVIGDAKPLFRINRKKRVHVRRYVVRDDEGNVKEIAQSTLELYMKYYSRVL